MKQKGIRHWIALIHNCFANVQMFLDPFGPVKGIGDALMFYIEASDLEQSGYVLLQVFDGLWQVATERDERFPVVKIGAAWCEDAYPVTFLRGSQDYYGIDVDMTARLQGLAKDREVVIERRLYDKINADYQRTGNKNDFRSFRSLHGPKREILKGVPGEVEVFRTQ